MLVALAAVRPAGAEPPSADWRTAETAHFRIHYPVATEDWALHVAARLESIRGAVGEEVGYTPPERVEVVIADPAADANGSAWPLVGAPRMVLWATPPASTSTLGHLSDWGELVAVHEYAHLAHLLRPSRNPLRQWIERHLVPLAPLATGTPRWAVEGYATFVEGRLTGSGRPASALRAAVIASWARAGRLPSYDALSSDRDSFLGGSMAYLVGSRFLEWAQARSGDPHVLVKLWAAATARQTRGFDAAWTRVFGAAPRDDYARFVAETAADSIAAERAARDELREGEVWLRRDAATSALTISPDGTRLAALVAERRRPTRIVVWDLAAPGVGESDSEARDAVPRDPDDPAAAPTPPSARRRLAALEEPPGIELLGARFLPDSAALLLTIRRADVDGVRHTRLALWSPGHRLDELRGTADLRDADPLPDGSRAVAVRWRDGSSQLVLVDLRQGGVSALTRARIDTIHEQPRSAPDGASLAWLEHRDGRWHVARAALAGDALSEPSETALDGGGEPLAFAWRRDGTHLYVAVARGGRIAIEAVAMTPGARDHRVTRTLGADFDPVPTPDGRELYFLALSPDGVDIRRLELDAATDQSSAPTEEPAPSTELPAFRPGPVSAPRPYGLGSATVRPLVGGWIGRPSGPLEIGVNAGDLLGRWRVVALGAVGSGHTRHGGALRGSLRRLPVDLDLDLAHVEQDANGGDILALTASRHLDLVRSALRLYLGASRLSYEGGGTGDRTLISGGLAVVSAWRRGGFELQPWLAAATDRQSGGASTRWQRLRLGLTALAGEARLALAVERHDVQDAAMDTDLLRLGGAPSSLAPPSFEPGRIDLPALPLSTLVGRRLDRLRMRAALPGLPADLVAERDRADTPDGERVRLRLVGLERRWSLAALPLVGLPGLELRVGVARIDGDRLDGELRGWLGLRVPFPNRSMDAALDSPP